MDLGNDYVDSEVKAIDCLMECFAFPLQSAGADTAFNQARTDDMLSYAGHFIQLSTVESVWW